MLMMSLGFWINLPSFSLSYWYCSRSSLSR